MIALGWTADQRHLPAGLYYEGRGPIRILATPPDHAACARDRLALQVLCFNAGVDFLPIAPSQSVCTKGARHLLANPHLSSQLRRLKSKGQLTLSLHLPETGTQCISNGRHWLRARKARQDLCNQYAAHLQKLAVGTNRPLSPLRQNDRTVQCDILVERTAVETVRMLLAPNRQAGQALAKARLLITGLWPAFGFAEFATKATHAA